MCSTRWVSAVMVLSNVVLACSAVLHGHLPDIGEREADGSYRPRDADHYSNDDRHNHNEDFDHEAILGSVKEAEEFDKLSPEEAKRRLAALLPRMDLDHDKHINREELKIWILNSFRNLSKEESSERFSETDNNRDGEVSWPEYLQETFGADSEEEISPDDTGDSGMLVAMEKKMWKAADKNGDGVLDEVEFEVFSNPEEHAIMHPFLVEQSLQEKDTNKDGKIDFQEYVGDRGEHRDHAWLVAEQEKFNAEDTNLDGALDEAEIHKWIIPDNDEIADEEVDHLFASADDDHDDLLSFDEIIEHHDTFVGSEATDYGNDLMGEHFDDEL